MRFAFIAALFVLPGCAELAQFRTVTRAAQSEILAEALNSAEYLQCKRITMELWQAKYGVSADKIKAWHTLCDGNKAIPQGNK